MSDLVARGHLDGRRIDLERTWQERGTRARLRLVRRRLEVPASFDVPAGQPDGTVLFDTNDLTKTLPGVKVDLTDGAVDDDGFVRRTLRVSDSGLDAETV